MSAHAVNDPLVVEGGQWIVKGGVKRFIPDDDRIRRIIVGILTSISAELGRRNRNCHQCGCLLVKADDWCPMCHWHFLKRHEPSKETT